MSEGRWPELLRQIPTAELDKLAILRVLECSNGIIQLRFREGHADALNAEDTRRAMPMRWRTWPRLKPTPVLRRSCVPVLLNYAKCCSWCRRWVCRKAPIA